MNEFTRVLVPVDGSPASERALLRAIAIAADHRAEIHFVHVIQRAQEQASFDDAQHAMHVVGDSLLDHAVALACEQDLLGTSAVLVTNERRRSIAQQILCAADAVAADLIVCGAHGTGSRTSLPHGSVADELVACCRVSLMLEHELPLTQAEAVA
ncbi:MAG: universal stress protein [Rhodanobacter sp.]|jgi:nucleotide-binding universal stress UspA family protein